MFTNEQVNRSVTFFGSKEQEKRADVTRHYAGRSLAVFATSMQRDFFRNGEATERASAARNAAAKRSRVCDGDVTEHSGLCDE